MEKINIEKGIDANVKQEKVRVVLAVDMFHVWFIHISENCLILVKNGESKNIVNILQKIKNGLLQFLASIHWTH